MKNVGVGWGRPALLIMAELRMTQMGHSLPERSEQLAYLTDCWMLVSSLTVLSFFFSFFCCQVIGTAEMNNLTMFYRAVQPSFREEQRMKNLLKLDVLVLQITLVGVSHIVSSLLKCFGCLFFKSPLISPQIPSLCSKTDSYVYCIQSSEALWVDCLVITDNTMKYFGLLLIK